MWTIKCLINKYKYTNVISSDKPSASSILVDAGDSHQETGFFWNSLLFCNILRNDPFFWIVYNWESNKRLKKNDSVSPTFPSGVSIVLSSRQLKIIK